MRQFQFRVGYENFALIHVSLVPDMHGEQKTKPTQTSVHALRGLGLLPDLVRVTPCCSVVPLLSMKIDRMSTDRPETSRAGNKEQDFHVLSRFTRAGCRCTRRLFCLPRPPPSTIPGYRRIPSKAIEPRIGHDHPANEGARSVTRGPLARAYNAVRPLCLTDQAVCD